MAQTLISKQIRMNIYNVYGRQSQLSTYQRSTFFQLKANVASLDKLFKYEMITRYFHQPFKQENTK